MASYCNNRLEQMAPVWIPSTGPVRLTGYVPPTAITSDDAIFHLVWTYNKPLMVGRKRDVSVMDLHCLVTSKSLTKHTPTASTKPAPDCFMPLLQLKTFSSSALMFPTLLPNAEAPPPKQGFYIHPDKAFINWWTNHKKQPPASHPTWICHPNQLCHARTSRITTTLGKHADAILQDISRTPTVHGHVSTLASPTTHTLFSWDKSTTLP